MDGVGSGESGSRWMKKASVGVRRVRGDTPLIIVGDLVVVL